MSEMEDVEGANVMERNLSERDLFRGQSRRFGANGCVLGGRQKFNCRKQSSPAEARVDVLAKLN